MLSHLPESKNKFWELFPQYKIPVVYKKLYTKDASTGKRNSSKLMWSIALLLEKKNNPYKERDIEVKKKLIEEDFMEDSIDWIALEEAIVFWRDSSLTVIEKYLVDLENKLNERRKLLTETAYTIENAKDLDTLFINTDKLITQYKATKDKVENEGKDSGQISGGRKESASESGEL